MVAISSALRSAVPNRRRRVRHKIQTPAYATFAPGNRTSLVDLNEIVDISEDGASIQCVTPLEVNRRVELCLDLAESAGQIFTTGQVTWSTQSGRCGFRFSELAPVSLFHLREWLFLNAMAGVANAETAISAPFTAEVQRAQRPSYSDILAALVVVQREAEALAADLEAALELIATRAQTLLRASAAAIALANDQDDDFMECRASVGPEAPPVGAQLRVGSGFSGECVRTARLLRCDDSETDFRVNRESCRALGIRSALAAPIRAGQKALGLIEVFSPRPNSFTEDDEVVIQRLAEMALAAVTRAATPAGPSQASAQAPAADAFPPAPGSVLFASPIEEKHSDSSVAEKNSGGISLPLSHLVILICAAATIALALGYRLAPTIQQKLRSRDRSLLQTVLASSPPSVAVAAAPPLVETATLDQLKQMAESGDPAAENALGRRYATGDGLPLDESAAATWFAKAAELGNVPAQSKLGSLYYAGRGVPKDIHQAYFWTVLARAGGDRGSKELAKVIFDRITRAEATTVEQQADIWLQQHQPGVKPAAAY
jgi:TPR repeat protein